MLELVTRLRTPSTTCEPIECFSKVLDGTFVACGSGISKGPNVVFSISFSTAICPQCLTSNLENKTMVYSQAFAPFHTFGVDIP
jgi:hypothetical protein